MQRQAEPGAPVTQQWPQTAALTFMGSHQIHLRLRLRIALVAAAMQQP